MDSPISSRMPGIFERTLQRYLQDQELLHRTEQLVQEMAEHVLASPQPYTAVPASPPLQFYQARNVSPLPYVTPHGQHFPITPPDESELESEHQQHGSPSESASLLTPSPTPSEATRGLKCNSLPAAHESQSASQSNSTGTSSPSTTETNSTKSDTTKTSQSAGLHHDCPANRQFIACGRPFAPPMPLASQTTRNQIALEAGKSAQRWAGVSPNHFAAQWHETGFYTPKELEALKDTKQTTIKSHVWGHEYVLKGLNKGQEKNYGKEKQLQIWEAAERNGGLNLADRDWRKGLKARKMEANWRG